jgi:hypothetical protein
MVASVPDTDNVSVAIVCKAFTTMLRPVGQLLASGSASGRARLGASEEGKRDERAAGLRSGREGSGGRG